MLSAVLTLAGLVLLAPQSGEPAVVAGGGIGDGAPATSAPLDLPTAIVEDRDGAILIAEGGSRRVRRVDPRTGWITTLLKLPAPDPSTDRAPQPGDSLSSALFLALDRRGDLFIGDQRANRVWRYRPASAELSTAAGDGLPDWPDAPPRDGDLALNVKLSRPRAVAVDAAGRLLVVDSGRRRIRSVDPASGRIATVLKTTGDVIALAASPDGNIYFLERDGARPFRLSPGARTAVALTANAGSRLSFQGLQIAIDPDGGAVFAEYSGQLWKTGPGDSLSPLPLGRLGEACYGLTAQKAGGYVGSSSARRTVKRVPPRGAPYWFAGSGSSTCCGDGGAPVAASLNGPEGLALDSGGRLYIADYGNSRIRIVDEDGRRIETLAGGGAQTGFKDGVDALSVSIGVQLLAVDPAGNVLFAQNDSPSIYRFVARTGTISRFAGVSGTVEFGGDGGPALAAALRVKGIACDRAGNVFVTGQNRIRRISAGTGVIETIAGTGKQGFFGDGGLALSADLGTPTAITIDEKGTIYFVDAANKRIRALDRSGRIRTVAGNGRAGPFTAGDALRNHVGEVLALAVDREGNVVYMDWSRSIRRLVVREQRLESLLERPIHDLSLKQTRAAPGLVVTPAGKVVFDVPQRNLVESFTAPSTGSSGR